MLRTILLTVSVLLALAVPAIAFGWVVDQTDPPAEQIGDMLGLLGLSAAAFVLSTTPPVTAFDRRHRT